MSIQRRAFMKITWIGQAGLLFDSGKAKIMIDPYLSNSVEKVDPNNFRRISVNEDLFNIEPDFMIFTHDHIDHYDPETAPRFLEKKDKKMTVLCPTSVWKKARTYGYHNYVEFNRYTEWTESGIRFCAVKAVHSDPFAIGVIIEDLEEKKIYYVTGDTLYNREIFKDLPDHIDVVFLPINGVGNNMNETDAVRFFRACGARRAVPYHVGMFDSNAPDVFDDENKITLEVYKESEL